MSDMTASDVGASAPTDTSSTGTTDKPIRITRRRLDVILTVIGALTTAVLLVAGILLAWGNNFARDYVRDELQAQNISFPDADSLSGQGRGDLAKYGSELVDTGKEAEAYASYIQGHVAGIAEGATYAELGSVERAAQAAVSDAIAEGVTGDELTALEEEAAAITTQRESIFRGEMLRGSLLNTYAWDTIGRIAGIASVVAFIAAALMLILTIAGAIHLRKTHA
ncbi:MAG: hypothetical protein KDB21_17050 [Acidimicrobiales bacterium]|nr:hypothetical protein [Acidimicrobiales bacterium]